MTVADITDDLMQRLRLRYNDAGWVILEGVGNGAGYGNSGWSDAIAMQTWPSKGLTVIGFEVKATKADWKREMNKPSKNVEWQGACDEWYVVAPKDVVNLAELPTSWGLMVPMGENGLQIASRCERDRSAVSPSRSLLAAVFRAQSRGVKEVKVKRKKNTDPELLLTSFTRALSRADRIASKFKVMMEETMREMRETEQQS